MLRWVQVETGARRWTHSLDRVRRRARRRHALLLTVLAVGIVGCGSDDPVSAPPTSSSTTVPSLEVSSLDGIRETVVRIEVEGTFEYPSGPSYNEAGSGSGFLISDDGLIVTNSHVVAGAGLVKVHTDWETEPFNGRVVGTSECADIAVVDIDVEGRNYLTWAEGAINAGQEIYVAGFPLGDPEFTLIDGIISKAKASGDTSWASIGEVIEHTGDTLPGSSGGPIVGPDGTVFGVNYAGDDLGQAFGISAKVARDVVNDILAAESTLTVGVNGWAHQDAYGSGVWVAGVVPDSSADRVGIRAGDLITRLAGLNIAEDGTLATYCDILDSHLPDRPFDVEVWRESEGGYLAGVFNSEQELEAIDAGSSVEAGVSETESSLGTELSPGDPYQSFEEVWGGDGEVVLELPVGWSDRSHEDWQEYDKIVGSALFASPDLEAWEAGWDTPGVFVGVSSSLIGEGIDPSRFLADLAMEECSFAEQIQYDDGFYVGAYNIWVGCGGTDTMLIDWAASDVGGGYLISAQFTVVTDADIEAMSHALSTLYLAVDLEY